MRITTAPKGLRQVTAVLFLSIPVAAVQTVIAMRAPWWKIPYQTVAVWAGTAAFFAAFFGHFMFRGRKWIELPLALCLALWTLWTAWSGLHFQNPALAFYGVFQVVAFAGYFVWLKRELRRSYIDPGVDWYQGLPQPVAGLQCDVIRDEVKTSFQVCRLDRDGAFLFSSKVRTPGEASSGPAELHFRFRDREIRCMGTPMCALIRANGFGFQFKGITPDQRKELGDFVEMLKGEGYVE